MRESQKRVFENLATYLEKAVSSSIPIAFLLGLYVVTIVKRWWEQFENVAWPDDLMFFVSAFIQNEKDDEHARITRRTIARYACLSAALAWRNISSRVLKRFPTADHLVQAGLMTEAELEQYQATKAPFGRWFLPLFWIQQLIMSYRRQNLIDSSQTSQMLNLLFLYKNKFIRLFVFDWVSIPLVYTQVCTTATYGYFLLCLIAKQHLDNQDEADHTDLNLYFPLLTVMQFLFYMGWLKVAERMMHPFGEGDDDFELNFLLGILTEPSSHFEPEPILSSTQLFLSFPSLTIYPQRSLDRHLYVSLMIVDTLHNTLPPQPTRDVFWDREPYLPHTKASGKIKEWRPQSKGIAKSLPFQEMALQFSVEDKQRQKSSNDSV